jgi:hypothetical protein
VQVAACLAKVSPRLLSQRHVLGENLYGDVKDEAIAVVICRVQMTILVLAFVSTIPAFVVKPM